MNDTHGGNLRRYLTSPSGLALLGFLGIAGYFLWTEHEAHVFAALPFVLVAGCLVMHLFMHRGHGGHGDSDGGKDDGHGPHGGSR